MRLILKSDTKSHVDNPGVGLTEELFGAIDSLLQDKPMGRQAGAQLEQLGEVRLTHFRQTRERANRQGPIQIFSNVFKDAHQTSRRYPECLLAGYVRSPDKSVDQIARQLARDEARPH